MSCHIPGKATCCTGAQGNCRIRYWFLTVHQRRPLKLNPTIRKAQQLVHAPHSAVFGLALQRYTVQSRSPSAERFINCCTCAYCCFSLSLSLIMHVARASDSTVNLKTHKASQSTWQLQAAHISLAPVSQTWSSNWEITPYPACPTLSITEFAPCSIQRQQRADSEQTDGEKSMRGANIQTSAI